MTTTQQMRHAGARHKSEKPSWVTRFAEKLQSPERSSRREKVARALGMLATIGATLTAATGISLYHDSGNIEPVGNLLNPVAEHVMTTDEDIAGAKGYQTVLRLKVARWKKQPCTGWRVVHMRQALVLSHFSYLMSSQSASVVKPSARRLSHKRVRDESFTPQYLVGLTPLLAFCCRRGAGALCSINRGRYRGDIGLCSLLSAR